MAYTTGTAATFAALRTALVDACVAAGWTWDAGNEVVYKGTNYLRVTTPAGAIAILGRTGLTTGDAPNVCQMGPMMGTALVFPVTYHAFTFSTPDEVYFVINAGDEYQWLAFGQSTQPGLVGSGMWFAGSAGSEFVGNVSMSSTGSSGTSNSPGLFWAASFFYGRTRNYFLHHDIGSEGWWPGLGTTGTTTVGITYATEVMQTQPNTYNMESVLLPVKAFNLRASSKYSQIGELVNARHIINTHYQDGEIITLGTDKWKIFPYFKKDPTKTASSSTSGSSGVYGMAIRYEGP